MISYNNNKLCRNYSTLKSGRWRRKYNAPCLLPACQYLPTQIGRQARVSDTIRSPFPKKDTLTAQSSPYIIMLDDDNNDITVYRITMSCTHLVPVLLVLARLFLFVFILPSSFRPEKAQFFVGTGILNNF